MTAGRKWSEELKARALELLDTSLGPAEIRKRLAREFDTTPPATSTLRKWAAEAGMKRGAAATRTSEKGGATPDELHAARLARLDVQRGGFSEAILTRLTGPSLELIAARLVDEAEVIQPRIDAARVRLEEALELLDGFKDSGPDDKLRQSAMREVQQSRLLYQFEASMALPLRDLVGVLTRSIGDHLALEGMAEIPELAGADRIVVELHGIPRGTPELAESTAVDEDDLTRTDG